MQMSSKFLTESTGEKIVKISQYLAKIWTKYDSLLFFGPPCIFLRAAALCYSAYMLSPVRPSVRQSHGWISRKRLKLG